MNITLGNRPILPTRYPELGYRQDAAGLWRIYAQEDRRPVGPYFASKAELLAHLHRYAAFYGCEVHV